MNGKTNNLRVSVRVKAGSSREKVEKLDDSSYAVWVRAKPTDGKANEAVIKILADYFDTAKSNVTLLKGHTSKIKIFEIIKSL